MYFNRPSDRRGSGNTRSRNMRSRCRCSMCPAIHINSRSWLRSSSTHEPSDPPLRVVFRLSLLPHGHATADRGCLCRTPDNRFANGTERTKWPGRLREDWSSLNLANVGPAPAAARLHRHPDRKRQKRLQLVFRSPKDRPRSFMPSLTARRRAVFR